jgi:hypothetical protein
MVRTSCLPGGESHPEPPVGPDSLMTKSITIGTRIRETGPHVEAKRLTRWTEKRNWYVHRFADR